MNSPNPYAPPKSEVADVHRGDPAPALWNPSAAANWSLLFSVVFGAVLHMKNWEALGEPEKAASSKKWAIGALVFFVAMILFSVFATNEKLADGLTKILGFALLLTWYFSSGRAQQRYVLAKFGKNYPRRGWLKPIGWALLAILGFIIVAGLIGGLIGYFYGGA
jgi:hypothetical protein